MLSNISQKSVALVKQDMMPTASMAVLLCPTSVLSTMKAAQMKQALGMHPVLEEGLFIQKVSHERF